jgi:hypothetical protein
MFIDHSLASCAPQALLSYRGSGNEGEMEEEKSPQENQDDELVELTKVQGEFEAQLIKGALDAQGIESMTRAGITQNVLPFTVDGLGVMKIFVRKRNLERAEEILDNSIFLDEDRVDDDQSDDEEPCK